MADRDQVSELAYLVQTERRGLAATSKMTAAMLLIGAICAGGMWPIAGVVCTVAFTGVIVRAYFKDRAYRRLVETRSEIASIERVKQLGRPAVRIVFHDGRRLTLPTWNTDRERVIAALETRELPAARLLR